jgi:carbon-monoxide dehydrogenase small subunit
MTRPDPLRSLSVNGETRVVCVDAGKPLVDVVRDDLKLTGTRVGCRNGDCGACTVLIDGASFKSCLVPAGRAFGHRIVTLEGVAGRAALHPVQLSFWDNNGFQCGFCLAGHILCVVELLVANPTASETQIVAALSGNLCRCTGYWSIVAAALQVVNSGFQDPDEAELGQQTAALPAGYLPV